MKSLDQAVQKFKALKQKLKQISQEPPRKSTRKLPQKLSGHCDKQNNQNLHNKMIMSVQPASTLDDSKIQTQKKGKNQHKRITSYGIKNNSLNYSERMVMSYRSEDDPGNKGSKQSSMNNSRISSSLVQYNEELKQKQKALSDINMLLEKKTQVLKKIEKMIGNTSTIDDLNFEKVMNKMNNINKAKKSIKAPNLFQMQVEGRKRSDSKPLTIRWKGQ